MNGPEILCELSRVLASEAFAVSMSPPQAPGGLYRQGALSLGPEVFSADECSKYATNATVLMTLYAILLYHGIEDVRDLRLESFTPNGSYFTFNSRVNA